mgnify:FL=1
MNEAFNKLDQGKQERIIRAALQEFAEKGYKHASTNAIVKTAGISKGMLFYYFNSKQDLYYFLVEYSIDTIRTGFIDKIDTSIPDVIERLAHIAYLKWNFFLENPELSMFITSLVLKDNVPLPEPLQKKYDELFRIGMEKAYFFNNADYRLFRDDIDPQKAIQLIQWTLYGYRDDFLQRYHGKGLHELPMEQLWEEFAQYLDILKKVFYRAETESIYEEK